ncbi:hypothetical protein H2O64_08245 [Kordia sp. YSTF-M3]|uniref:Tail fiber protein n=1 Tax=Kordia aestuariivivens TaxID=2759037 RepID=A0ABR7Q7W2_9FLAO|nr:hypothetical protein [Kordia aestuariivivens]MBC8754662.1 hypothetical protein [Kordia aestuariivivens]
MNNLIDKMLFAMQQQNLVYNYNFLYYSNKEVVDSKLFYNHPDGWLYNDIGEDGEISFNNSTKSCLIQKSAGESLMTLNQVISEFPRSEEVLCGKQITAVAVIENPKAANYNFNITFSLFDGVSDSSKIIFFKPGDKKEINIVLNVDDNATKLIVELKSSSPKAIIYVNKIYANIGEIALETLPCVVNGIIGERKQYIVTENAPAEELSLCNGFSELTDEYTRLKSVINNRFGVNNATGNPYLINMGGYFSRAWDNNSGVDPDATNRKSLGNETIKGDRVSTIENDIFLKHHHGLDFSKDKQILTGDKGVATVINLNSTSNTKDESEGKETRPKNIAELYTIKWA